MIEDLSQMIMSEKVDTDEKQATDIDRTETVPTTVKTNGDTVVSPLEETQIVESTNSNFDIPVTLLSEWVPENKNNFSKIRQIKIIVPDINSEETLVFAVPHPSKASNSDGLELKTLEMIKNANTFNILNIPAMDMNVYGNGFKIIYDYDGTTFLKCYGVKSGVIVNFSIRVGDYLIPYATTKLGKKDEGLNVIAPDVDTINENLTKPLRIEDLQLMYKQSQKFLDELTDKKATIDWFIKRAEDIVDINHMMQIDSMLMWLATTD